MEYIEEAEQIDKEEGSAGTLVKLNEALQDQKKIRVVAGLDSV